MLIQWSIALRSVLRLWLASGPGMGPELVQLFAHGETGDAEPARGLCLVALCQVDGLGEDFPLRLAQQLGMCILEFAALRRRQETGDIIVQRAGPFPQSGRSAAEDLTHLVGGDAEASGHQEC